MNPKLEKLREMILKGCRDEESRGIVFVKTRDLAIAIVSWMKETPGLKELNAIKFVGQNMSADKGGMLAFLRIFTFLYTSDRKLDNEMILKVKILNVLNSNMSHAPQLTFLKAMPPTCFKSLLHFIRILAL